MRRKLYYIVIIVSLLTLICVRLFIDTTPSVIQFINFLALPVAFFNLINELHHAPKSVKGTICILFLALIVFSILILSNIVSVSDKTNDIILLITLFISLPAKFYGSLFHHKKQEDKL